MVGTTVCGWKSLTASNNTLISVVIVVSGQGGSKGRKRGGGGRKGRKRGGGGSKGRKRGGGGRKGDNRRLGINLVVEETEEVYHVKKRAADDVMLKHEERM